MTLVEANAAGFLPPSIAQWAEKGDAAALAYGVNPCLVGAILARETAGGTSKDLDMHGPRGTGDFGKRNPERWGCAMPPDGRGWGRGLMQIDYGGHKDWCNKKLPSGIFAWEDSLENLKMGCAILHANLTTFQGAEDAAACAYNAGSGVTFKALQNCLNGIPRLPALDAVTTGKNYVSWVLAKRDLFAGVCASVQ